MPSKRNTIPSPDPREERRYFADTIYRLACISAARDQWEILADGTPIARPTTYEAQKRAFDSFIAGYEQ